MALVGAERNLDRAQWRDKMMNVSHLAETATV
jgi:hypothetical protein